jgi:hypothetical protein
MQRGLREGERDELLKEPLTAVMATGRIMTSARTYPEPVR